MLESPTSMATEPRQSGRRPPLAWLCLAIAAYAAVAIWWTYPLVWQAGTHVPHFEAGIGVAPNDQRFSVSITARNAAAILDLDFRRLIEQPVCDPWPRSALLGEHVLETSLLALPAYALTENPIFAHNVACLLMLVIGGTTMFALIYYWTGSGPAGLFAGALLAYFPTALNEYYHPYDVGMHWAPLALLAFERLLDGGRWRWVLVLAGAAALQCLISSYSLLAFAFFAGPFGLVRLVQRRDELDARRLVGLAVALVLVAAAVLPLIGLYMEASARWMVLPTRNLWLHPYRNLLHGAWGTLGFIAYIVALALPFLGRHRRSPVAAAAVGCVVCAALSGSTTEASVSADAAELYPWLVGWFPALGSVRQPMKIALGAQLGLAVLAGISAGRIDRLLGDRLIARAGLAAGLFVAVVVESLHPPVSTTIYGTDQTVVPVERTPPDDVLAAYRVFSERGHFGPIVETPMEALDRGYTYFMPHYYFYAAYHGQTTTTCFNSHKPPTYFNMSRMVDRLDSRRGRVELAAAGYRNLVVHHGDDTMGKLFQRRFLLTPELLSLYRGRFASSFLILTEVYPHSNPDLLSPAGGEIEETLARGYGYRFVGLRVRNDAKFVFALQRPIEPLRVLAECVDGAASDRVVETRTVLPLALAPGATDTLWFPIDDLPDDCDVTVSVPDLGWTVTVPHLASPAGGPSESSTP